MTLIAMALVCLAGCRGDSGEKKSGSEGDFAGSRKTFAKGFAQIKEGMRAEAVVGLLGKPDDVRTQEDPGGISWTGVREIWGYGTDRHLGFATLGTVAIDESGRVKYRTGSDGAEELVARVGEGEVRRLLQILSRTDVQMVNGERFNPRDTIVAVNALQPLGKRAGVEAMREYLRVRLSLDGTGLIMVMRALFEIPPMDLPGRGAEPPTSRPSYLEVVRPGYLRPPLLGAPDWSPKDPTQFPRFPLVIVDDIPLLPITGYTLAGMPESAWSHLDSLERSGEWRREPLKPTDDPMGAYEKAVALIPNDESQWRRALVARQFRRLIDTVYQEPREEGDNQSIPYEEEVAAFEKSVPAVRRMGIGWDAKSECYVRKDGSTLPAVGEAEP